MKNGECIIIEFNGKIHRRKLSNEEHTPCIFEWIYFARPDSFIDKIGVYKSRDSLVFSAKNNEFVYELLAHLNTTENMLDERCENATKLLMQLSIFLVLYKVSHQHKSYLNIKLDTLNSIVLTGGITKVLSEEEMNDIVSFFYKKILNFHISPQVVVDKDYAIWTLGMKD